MIYYIRVGYPKYALKIKYISPTEAYGYPRFNGVETLGRWNYKTGWEPF